MKLKTPYADLWPPMSTEEFAALKADIDLHGVQELVDVTEDGEVLDGHHRLKIVPDAPTRIVEGLSPLERLAHVYRTKLVRGKPSMEQIKAIRKELIVVYLGLRDDEGRSQPEAAAMIGIPQQTLSRWGDKSKGATHVGNTYNCSVKVPKPEHATILKRAEAGETQSRIAADYGLSQPHVSSIIKAEAERRDIKTAKEEAAARSPKGQGIITGDFRKLGDQIKDSSVDLIFTDPPYDKAASILYADLAEFAARILRPGGLCIAYSGQVFLPDVLDALREHLTYAWLLAIKHTGGELRFRKYRIHNAWKPLAFFYKPPLDHPVWWDWVSDIISGGKEKTDHEWQQAEAEAEYYMKAFCPDKGVVVDPFCGSGTTGVVAKRLGFKWTAFEIDPGVAGKARERIAG